MVTATHVGPGLFDFFRDLAENNNRDWFKVNKSRYETEVKEPLLQFVRDFESRLHAISSHYVADARPVGGSMFRIYRDTRFAKDKTPYKTNAGLHFRHEAGKDAHAPGIYLHFEPGGALGGGGGFGGGGIWHPDSATLLRIRNAIVERSTEWRSVTEDPAILAGHEFGGDSLKRPPKGFDPEHPLIEDLKKKDHFVHASYSEDEATGPDFIDRVAADVTTISPYLRFLTEAVGLPY